VEKQKKTKKEKTAMLGSISEQSGESVPKKKIAYGGKDLQKKVLSMERKVRGVGILIIISIKVSSITTV